MPSPLRPAEFCALVPSGTSSLCDRLLRVFLQMPKMLCDFFTWALDNDGSVSDAFRNEMQVIPTGTVIARLSTVVPSGWLTCNGQEVSRTTYALLFSIIGTTYGAGNGSTTFNLPNFQDRFLYGKGSTSTVGDAGGEETHTLSVPELPAHVHRITARGSNAPSNGHGIIAGANDGGTGPFLYDDTTLASDFMSIESIGQDVPHENRPPFSRVVWLVKA